jgi:hypothetical protein
VRPMGEAATLWRRPTSEAERNAALFSLDVAIPEGEGAARAAEVVSGLPGEFRE